MLLYKTVMFCSWISELNSTFTYTAFQDSKDFLVNEP